MTAEQFYRGRQRLAATTTPPPAWVKLDGKNGIRPRRYHGIEHYGKMMSINPAEVWVEPDTRWYSQYAAKILPLLPLDGILASDAKGPFLDFLFGLLNWTIEKNAPPWMKPSGRDRDCGRSIRMDTFARTNTWVASRDRFRSKRFIRDSLNRFSRWRGTHAGRSCTFHECLRLLAMSMTRP